MCLACDDPCAFELRHGTCRGRCGNGRPCPLEEPEGDEQANAEDLDDEPCAEYGPPGGDG